MELTLEGVRLRAVSVGGLETCIEVPDDKLCFDIGRCPPSAAKLPRVFFTHPHVDHMGGVVTHASLRDLWGMKVPDYYVPAEYVDDFEVLIATWAKMTRAEVPCRVHPVAPGDVIEIGRGRRVVAFRAIHRVPTLGYAVIRDRRVLRSQYRDLEGRELGALRKKGEVLDDVVEEVEVAFCGDTCIDVLDREVLPRSAKVLVLECTFLEDKPGVEWSRKGGHVHIDEICAKPERFADVQALLLTHFSNRYSNRRIQRVLDEKLPPELKEKVTPLLAEPPWAR